MVPRQNDAALSTPVEIDYVAVAREVIQINTKNAIGTTKLVSHKGKQHVFALVCAAIRSALGKEKMVPELDAEGKATGQMVPYLHPPVIVAKIHAAIEDVWKSELLKFLTFGGSVSESDIKITGNSPVTKVIPADKSKARDSAGNAICDLDVRLKLAAVVTRAPKTTQEAVFVATMGLEKANKRLTFMNENPAKYTGDDIREQLKVITVHEWKIIQLKDLAALEARQAAALAVLDAELTLGKVTQEQYALARKTIESAVR